MLLSLQIQNIALIERVTIPFSQGLHVLTGETGAGKSMVVDAVNLALGGRAERELIRTGCERAFVEALFDLADCPAAREVLAQQQIEPEDGLLAVSREITASGRSICRVCGMVVPLAFVRRLTAPLMDVHGQHEHQSLLDEKKHLPLLDAFGDEAHARLVAAVRDACEGYRAAHKEYEQLRERRMEREQRMDMLRFQRGELAAAQLEAGEEETLARERDRCRYAAKIGQNVRDAYALAYAGGEGRGAPRAAAEQVRDAAAAMGAIAALDDRYAALKERLDSLYYELEDVGLTLRDMLGDAQVDPQRQEQIETRLDLIRRLSRKYGATTGDMLAALARIEEELARYENLDDVLDALQKEEKKRLAAWEELAGRLSAARKALAARLCEKVEEQLAALGMAGTRFEARFARHDAPAPAGWDELAFLIAPNPGEPAKPLAKTASGGELSRLMLAIKSAAAERGAVPSMVFDEVDTGISGRVAQAVAEKLAALAKHRQVICVTHLQQIAAMADRHYLVDKQVRDGRTFTSVTQMDDAARVRELARMVSGANAGGESGLRHAGALLQEARERKQSL